MQRKIITAPAVFLFLILSAVVAAWSEPLEADDQPHFRRAIQSIQRQVDWFQPSSDKHAREFLIGMATMNYVQSRMSPLNYAQLVNAKSDLPRTTEECLALESGICGNQVQAFLDIVRQFGIRARPVEFYLRGTVPAKNHGHICAEIYYKDGWRLFDITWGTYFRHSESKFDDVMSWTMVQQASDSRSLATTNSSDLWYQQWCAADLDPLEYVDWEEMDVLIGRSGTVQLRAKLDKNQSLIYTPTHQPNYVGRNSSDANLGSVSIRLLGANESVTQLTLEILGTAGSGVLRIEGEQGSASVDLRKIKTGQQVLDLSNVSIKNELRVSVVPENPGKVGYVVFKRITLHGNRQ